MKGTFLQSFTWEMSLQPAGDDKESSEKEKRNGTDVRRMVLRCDYHQDFGERMSTMSGGHPASLALISASRHNLKVYQREDQSVDFVYQKSTLCSAKRKIDQERLLHRMSGIPPFLSSLFDSGPWIVFSS